MKHRLLYLVGFLACSWMLLTVDAFGIVEEGWFSRESTFGAIAGVSTELSWLLPLCTWPIAYIVACSVLVWFGRHHPSGVVIVLFASVLSRLPLYISLGPLPREGPTLGAEDVVMMFLLLPLYVLLPVGIGTFTLGRMLIWLKSDL